MTVLRNFYNASLEPIKVRLQTEVPSNYKYHSMRHTLDVIEMSEQIARAEGLSETDMEIVRIAALFHDTGFIRQRKNHEAIGCSILHEAAVQFGLEEEDIKKIQGCIMATNIPQSPQNLLEKVLCDADLDYLGRKDFEEIGEQLYEELVSCGEIASRDQWNWLQIEFLSRHKYHTQYSIDNRTPVLQANLEGVRKKVGEK